MAPPESAPMEDLLQWLRPAAFLALLQSLALLLRVVHWFFEGCGVLMDAALSAVQVCHHGPQMRRACTSENRPSEVHVQNPMHACKTSQQRKNTMLYRGQRRSGLLPVGQTVASCN